MMVRVLVLLSLLLPAAALAQQPAKLAATLVAEGLDQPLLVTSPPGDPRLFIVEKTGAIRIFVEGALAPTPFLDIGDRVSGSSEQGLLGLAFHPDYARNGRFFINYTDTRGDTRVEVCTVSSDPARADPSSCTGVLSVAQPYANHNGGWIAFGPEGYLYIGMGDGGSGGDPQANGQNTDALLGKILRIDVDGGAPYAIPPDNPFANGGGAPEVFLYGLRNPWRNAFDGTDLYIADVGQGGWEEVSVVPVEEAGGANLGWAVLEGERCFGARTCASEGLVMPVHVYGHEGGACSITGGYVYRGRAIPEIAGLYFFGDYCSEEVWSFRYAGGKATELADWTAALGGNGPLSSFGTDSAGELYMTTLSGGLWKIVRGE